MASEMEDICLEEMETELETELETEVLSSMWPEDMNEAGKQFNIENPKPDEDMLEEVNINRFPSAIDFNRLGELGSNSDNGSSQLAHLVKNWEYKQANAVRLLREELHNLNKQQQESELKKLEILEEHRFEEERFGGEKRPVSIFDERLKDVYQKVARRKHDIVVQDDRPEIDAEYDSNIYWKQRALHLETRLEASVHREQILIDKLQESIENLSKQSSPVEELSQMLKRADNFLHFVLQNAPVVIGHQDKELRYRFIYNHFPSLRQEDIIGKTDVEIFTGSGVKESQEFKREVLERGRPAKREITFETDLFGSKTFLIFVEPVFSKTGETIGVNYMGMEVTDQVRKREKMAKLREEIAVQRAKETELNKTIHITEETMRAKQMLATMSHEIRSPLSGVLSMTEILSTTHLDKEQRQLVKVMLSSGDLVLQLINDILDLSKVESGVMRLEATKFRPREVVKHVLQTAAASLQKVLTLEGEIADDVPIEVIGDVLRIRQILTNLISNAIKFTHEGRVGIKLYVVSEPNFETKPAPQGQNQSRRENTKKGEKGLTLHIENESLLEKDKEGTYENHDDPRTPKSNVTSMEEDEESLSNTEETTVWLRCDVYDTGIGIPETALPSLFKKYMQVGDDTARKYGGTGLGLAICKQLVELMGGQLTVSSKEHHGSTFTFVLPYKISPLCDGSDDPDELSDGHGDDSHSISNEEDINCGFFQFLPRTLGPLFTPHSSCRSQKLLSHDLGLDSLNKSNRLSKDHGPLPSEKYPVTTLKTSSQFEGAQVDDDMICQESNRCGYGSTSSTSNGSAENPCTSAASESFQRQNRDDSNPECSSNFATENVTMAPRTPRILLVEDSKINVMVAQSMLKQLGHKIDVVYNGVEAVRAVQRNSYDLILMDVFMPEMDGLQATRLIRSYEQSGSWEAAQKAGIELQSSNTDSARQGEVPKRTPIIAMTANTLSESSEECFANGMDSFVSKPVTFQTLKQCLNNYLH